MNKAVLLFSGGLDSYCLGGVYKDQCDLYGLTITYGHRSKEKELDAVRKLSPNLEFAEHHIIDMDFLQKLYGKSNILTTGNVVPKKKFDYSLVIPVRNAIFLSIATAWAYSIGATKVLFASPMGDSDYASPDSGIPFIKQMDKALRFGELLGINTGKRKKVTIYAPILDYYTQYDMLRKAYRVLGDSISHTWSCHIGKKYQCGQCQSCQDRINAFYQADIEDRTKYINNT